MLRYTEKIKNLQGRSVRLTVLAFDDSGKQINIEISSEDKGASSRRTRYHSSILDANLLLSGDNFEKLPETYVIFITERDVLKKSLPLYRVERCILETNEAFRDGTHIMYVNGENRDETPLGRLMHDFSCTDPEDMNYRTLTDRTRYFKNDEEGVRIMCRLLEDMRMEAMEEGKKRRCYQFSAAYAKGWYIVLRKIAVFAGLSYDEVRAIAENK